MGVCLVMFHLQLPSGIKGLKVSCRYLRNNHTKSEAPHQLLCLKKNCSENIQKTPRKSSVTKPIFSIFASLEVDKYIEYRISSNKRRTSNQHRPLISAAPLGIHIEISASPLISAYQNSCYILLGATPKCIWNQYGNTKITKMLLIFTFFHYAWFIDSENLCFIHIFKEKMSLS